MWSFTVKSAPDAAGERIAVTLSDRAATYGHNRLMGTSDDEPFLTETEAAEVLRISPRTLRRWRQKRSAGKGIPAPPVAGYSGRHALYRRSELLAWIRRPTGR
jgi:hypothetical protein